MMRLIRDLIFVCFGVSLATLFYLYIAVAPGRGPTFTPLEKYKLQELHDGRFADDYRFESCENGGRVVYWSNGDKQWRGTACWK